MLTKVLFQIRNGMIGCDANFASHTTHAMNKTPPIDNMAIKDAA